MRVQDILTIPSLEGCRLVAGSRGLDKPVTGINILEAIDIEKWGSEGLIILSSYFALGDLSAGEMERFFSQLDTIGISAVIIKIDRFVAEIPLQMVQLCEEYGIPLIQIGSGTKYESIILEILTPLINKNAQSLHKYYHIHKELTDLSLQMHSLDTILLHLGKLLGCDITLYNTIRGTGTGTNPALERYQVLEDLELEAVQYRSFAYRLRVVRYGDSGPVCRQLAAPIPYIQDNEYELILHNMGEALSVDDFMAIENAIRFLQLELLKQHSVKSHMRLHMNTLVNEILTGRSQERNQDLCEALGISAYPWYQVLSIKCRSMTGKLRLDSQMAFLRRTRYLLRDRYPNCAFYESTESATFLLNLNRRQDALDTRALQGYLDNLHTEDTFSYLAGASVPCEKAGIPAGGRQADDTVRVLEIMGRQNLVSGYEELGVNRLFLQMGSLEEVRRYIPAWLMRFYTGEPELFHTLSVYLDTGKSLKDTAQRLFLHPKTVKYRIDKIAGMDLLRLDDPEDILQVQLAARMLRLFENGEAGGS